MTLTKNFRIFMRLIQLNMEKKVIIEFNFGEKHEINAEIIAKLIAERFFRNESETDKVRELLNDEMLIFEFIWDLPWVELIPHIADSACKNKPACSCLAWKRGEAKVSVNW